MNLIDLYVSEVGRSLPAKTRDDIEREIRSLIEDMLEDAVQERDRAVNEHDREAGKQGRQPDEQMIYDVLKKMGPPEKVAESYLPPRYLIGPKYYPTFMMVLRIVLTVILVISAIGLGVELGEASGGSQALLSAFGTGIAEMLGALIAAFGNVVLVFAILQWLVPEPKFDKKEWDPRALKSGPDPERVKTVDMVIGIVGSILLLLLLNVYPQWIGVTSFTNGEWVHVRVLTDAFTRYIPWMSLLLVAQLALDAYLLRQTRWTTAARWTSIGIHAASIALLGILISGPALVGFDPADLARLGWADNVASVAQVNDGLNLLMRISLGISLVMQVIEVGKILLRLAGNRISLPADLTR